MKVIVLRWPLLALKGKGKSTEFTRTKSPVAKIDCHTDEHVGERGLAHVKFPGLMGWYDFRLSTGRCTVASMADYVIDKESLLELRKRRDEQKAVSK